MVLMAVYKLVLYVTSSGKTGQSPFLKRETSAIGITVFSNLRAPICSTA